jgi:ABC-type transporter Mla maintaining outer membrane lipid asymmetry ATPase subunit MlaF
MASAFAIADQLALMHEGRFLVAGSPDEVRASADPVVRRFLDRQPPEFFDGSSGLRSLFGGEG